MDHTGGNKLSVLPGEEIMARVAELLRSNSMMLMCNLPSMREPRNFPATDTEKIYVEKEEKYVDPGEVSEYIKKNAQPETIVQEENSNTCSESDAALALLALSSQSSSDEQINSAASSVEADGETNEEAAVVQMYVVGLLCKCEGFCEVCVESTLLTEDILKKMSRNSSKKVLKVFIAFLVAPKVLKKLDRVRFLPIAWYS